MQQLKKWLWACETAQQVNLLAPKPNNQEFDPLNAQWKENLASQVILSLHLMPVTPAQKHQPTVITVFSNLLSRLKDLCSHIQPTLLPALYLLGVRNSIRNPHLDFIFSPAYFLILAHTCQLITNPECSCGCENLLGLPLLCNAWFSHSFPFPFKLPSACV